MTESQEKNSTFIHLHTHTEYSILDGALRLADLVKAAKTLNMPAVAITDHGNIFGAVSFFRLAKEEKIKPILGCEMYVAPGSRKDKNPEKNQPAHFHLLLLVKDALGYRNLCELITRSYTEGFYYKPRIDKELLARHSQGLIGLSACLKGEVSYYLEQGREEEAERAAREYARIFSPGDFYIELQDHGLEAQQRVNPRLVALARKLGLPLVATNDVHYFRKEDAASHDVLLCIQTNKKVSEADRIRFGTQEFYFKSSEEMAALFQDVPEAVVNTTKIAARCNFDFPAVGYSLPRFQPPPGFSLEEYFEKIAWEGLERKLEVLRPRIKAGQLPSEETYRERLKKEISLVKDMGFAGYFLIVWDLIREARSRGIPVGPGRGSAAGSLLAFVLGITAVDPIEYNLLFERFLNPERVSLPDIDIDFCGRRRDEIIHYATEKYGRENVCQIITFGTMAGRQAVRDVGRALEVPLPEVDKIAKMIPPQSQGSAIDNALQTVPQLKELYTKNSKITHLLDLARKLEGQVRHPSIHAAGIVIAPKPLTEFLPLYMSTRGEITTQFPMQDIEALGLLKMDLLGLRNLTVIKDTLELIKKDTGEDVDIDHVPLDDKETFKLFQAGNTDGVFQFESAGMKALLRNYKPENFRDLIALNALYRPGPLQSGMTEEFIKRKHHPESIKYDLPELEPILKETKGLIVYQEQVMMIATELAGFSLAEADLLRKAIGKKKTAVMKAQRERFIQGAKKRGISQAQANQLFETINYFAGYGFNKSHSAAYAYLAFQTAYLKAHYPVYFLAALLTSEAEKGATDQVVKYINECKEMGIQVLPPDINESELTFTVVKGNIRFGLSAIKNVGEQAVRSILEARRKRGRFKSPFDLVRDVDPKAVNRKVLESLIKAGALDSLGWKRSQLFHLVDSLIEYSHKVSKLRHSPQSMLFGQEELEAPPIPPEIADMKEWDEAQALAYEKEALGFYISSHPLAQYGNYLRRLVTHSINELEEAGENGREIRVAGIIASLKQIKTRREERMATFVLEDMTGQLEVVVFPEAYQKNYEYLREDLLVWVRGKLSREADSPRLILSEIMLLEEALEKQAKKVVIRLYLPGLEKVFLEELKELLAEHPGKCPVYFELEKPLSFRLLLQSVECQGVRPSDKLRQRVENLLGQNTFFVDYNNNHR